jgi:hypothetical protein
MGVMQGYIHSPAAVAARCAASTAEACAAAAAAAAAADGAPELRAVWIAAGAWAAAAAAVGVALFGAVGIAAAGGRMPHLRAMATAVGRLSPVTIRTVTYQYKVNLKANFDYQPHIAVYAQGF